MSLDKGPAIFPLSADTIPTLTKGEKKMDVKPLGKEWDYSLTQNLPLI